MSEDILILGLVVGWWAFKIVVVMGIAIWVGQLLSNSVGRWADEWIDTLRQYRKDLEKGRR